MLRFLKGEQNKPVLNKFTIVGQVKKKEKKREKNLFDVSVRLICRFAFLKKDSSNGFLAIYILHLSQNGQKHPLNASVNYSSGFYLVPSLFSGLHCLCYHKSQDKHIDNHCLFITIDPNGVQCNACKKSRCREVYYVPFLCFDRVKEDST